jgi:hypothetical protein
MVGLLRHRQTKGPVSARPHLNRRATPRLYLIDLGCRGFECNGLFSTLEKFVKEYGKPHPDSKQSRRGKVSCLVFRFCWIEKEIAVGVTIWGNVASNIVVLGSMPFASLAVAPGISMEMYLSCFSTKPCSLPSELK